MGISVNGAAIREIRTALRISADDLAKEVGVSRPYISKIELGLSKGVSLKVLDALELALYVQDRRALLANPAEK